MSGRVLTLAVVHPCTAANLTLLPPHRTHSVLSIPCTTPCAFLSAHHSFFTFRKNPATQVLGPDVEYIISRAQAIQQGTDSSVLTAEHLQQAISSLQGGAGAAAGDGGLTKEDLEATMKQMLMVRGGGRGAWWCFGQCA